MKESEQKIIDKMIEHQQVNSIIVEKACLDLLNQLQATPFGTCTAEFLNHIEIEKFLKPMLGNDNFKYLIKKLEFWMLIENYIVTKNNFRDLEKELESIKAEISGTNIVTLLPHFINPQLIRNVYLSNDENLIGLFLKYLPIPNVELFKGHTIPPVILKREQDAIEHVIKVLEKNDWDLPAVENAAITYQRIFRSKQRRKEEIARIKSILKQTQSEYCFLPCNDNPTQELKDANTPYMPQKCSRELAERIVRTAEKVKLFSAVKHLTAAITLPNVFDTNLYGRRTLMNRYLSFRPAVLTQSEIDLDGDVVCCGANEIDMGAMQEYTVEIKFDSKKISKNPCVSYKQRDFGFRLARKRPIFFAGNTEMLFFTHTALHGYYDFLNHTRMQFFGNNDSDPFSVAHVHNHLLIGYDLKKMHQILTLNFFRFIDNAKLPIPGLKEADVFIKKFYANISKLNDEELVAFLQDLGTKMTDTMEFNFYGAYKIDFSSILHLKLYKHRDDLSPYVLDMPKFISELRTGNIEALRDARKNMPTLFDSYRFIDYLLGEINNNEAIDAELKRYREPCTVPFWIRELHKAQDKLLDKPRINHGLKWKN